MKKNYIIKVFLSLLIAIIITFVLSVFYAEVRSLLLDAISNNSISFLSNFDLIGKIQTKCGFETIPTVSELNQRFLLFYKIGLFWFVFLLLVFFAPRKLWNTQKSYFWPKFTCPTLQIKYHKISTFILIICILIIYFLIYYIIYLSWFGGDDYYCGMTQGQSFVTRFSWWCWCFVTHVSRIGEIIFYIFPYSLDKSQHLFITPLFICVFPFIVKRAIGNVTFSMNTWKGILFYICIAIISFMGIGEINIITGYAACTNYIYPTIIFLFFLSYYTIYRGELKSYSTLTYILFCLMSVIAGWATEGLAVAGSLYLFGWLLYWGIKKQQVDKLHYYGIMSFLIGACNVVFSPGPSIRGALTHTLTGGNVPYNLTVLPLYKRFLYTPELFQALWPCVSLSVTLIVIILLYYFFNKSRLRKVHYQQVLLWLVLAFISGYSYIVGAIPNSSTFTPASYFVLCAFAYLFGKLLIDKQMFAFIIVAFLSVYTVGFLSPRILAAQSVKKYETIRNNRIQLAIKSGEKHITLPPTFPFTYKPIEKGFSVFLLSDNPEKNGVAVKFYKVESIVEKQH